MKQKLQLFILFLVFSTAHAQQEISSEYSRQADAMFAPLNKTLVPHGILLDFGMEFPRSSEHYLPAVRSLLTL